MFLNNSLREPNYIICFVLQLDGFYAHDAPMLNERFFPKDSFYSTLPTEGSRYPHLQVRDLSYELDMSSAWHTLCGGARTKLRMLEGLSFEARGGEILAIMATSGMHFYYSNL